MTQAQKVRARIELMQKRPSAITKKGIEWLLSVADQGLYSLEEIRAGDEPKAADTANYALCRMEELPCERTLQKS